MEDINLLHIFLSSLLTLEEIGVPVVVYLMYKYVEEKKMKHRVASTYFKVTWFMTTVLTLSAIEAAFIVLYLVEWLKIDHNIFISIITLFFLIPIVTIPISILLVWIKELR